MRKEVRLASVVIAGAEVLAACNGVPVPTQTPQPNNSISIENQSLNPNVIKTPNATIILPRMTPSPSPVPSASPEATPVPSIESVKLVSEGLVTREAPELINVYDGTVVAIEKNPDGTVKQFAVTVAGNKIVKVCSKIFPDFCTFTATTFWLNVKEPTKLADINSQPNFKQIGQGSKEISPYIKIGETIPEIQISLAYYPDYPVWDKLDELNRASFAKLNDSVGKTFPRSYKGFVFNPVAIDVQP